MSRNKKQKSLEELIQNSGHNLHMRVAQMLRNKGLEVFISPTYRDDPTGIVREIDILAIYKGKTTIPFALCVECKYFRKG